MFEPVMTEEPQHQPVAVIEEVIVTAARLPSSVAEVAYSVARVDETHLARAGRLDQALSAVPAVSLFRRTSSLSANPTTQGISLRAIAPSGAGRALVTLDGVPLNDPFGGWVLWSQMPVEALSGVEIVRGAGAGPYGAGALTGVIQLREREEGSVVEASLAERGGRRLGAASSYEFGSARLTASGQYEHSDGYVAVRGSRRGAADQALGLEARAAGLRLDTPMDWAGLNAALSLRASVYDEDRGSGLKGTASSASGHLLSATLAQPASTADYGWRLQAWHRESDFANSSASVAADRSGTTPANDQYETPAEGWGLNAALRRQSRALYDGLLEWELGADARFNEGETHERFRYMGGQFTRDRRAGGEGAVIGLYGEASWSNELWLMAGGLRLDRWENQGGFRRERDLLTGHLTLTEDEEATSGDVVSARLAARRMIGSGWAVRAAAYSGFRPATLNELHRPFRVGNDITEANAALVPERLKGIEAGLAFEGLTSDFSATLFWNEIEDAIVNVTLAEGPGTFPRAGFVPADGVLRQRQNAGTIEAVGLELSGRQALSDGWDLRGAVSITDARMQRTGLRPAQAPIWSATLGVDWQALERLHLWLGANYESKRFDDDLNRRVLGSSLTLDSRLEWQMAPTRLVWIAVQNLTDEDVEVSQTASDVAGYAAPRTLSMGLRLSY